MLSFHLKILVFGFNKKGLYSSQVYNLRGKNGETSFIYACLRILIAVRDNSRQSRRDKEGNTRLRVQINANVREMKIFAR